MTSSVETSIRNISASLAQIANMDFRVRHSMSDAALASTEEFEARYIRDADEAEVSLFEPLEGRGHREAEESGWAIGPPVVTAQSINIDQLQSSLVQPHSKPHPHTGDAAVTRSYLMAIKKLLDVYPQPRLAEHVQALSRQLETIEGSIMELQAALRSSNDRSRDSTHMFQKPKSISRGKTKITTQKAINDLQDHIQREQLEILALTDLRDEKKAELRKLSEQIMQVEIKSSSIPSPKKLRTKTPSKRKSCMLDMNDPFVISRTESLRRSIQRVKSPLIRHEPSSSALRPTSMDQDDDNNIPNTPTPKSFIQKELERNLAQLKTHSRSRSKDTQLITSPPRDIPEPCPEPPVASSPIQETVPSPPTQEEAQLPQSRLATVERLNAAFWKSATVITAILENSQEIKARAESTLVPFNDTIAALNHLVDSYPTPSLTPTQLIEAVLYQELLKCLSCDKSNGNLEAISRGDNWCIPLEQVKAKLIKACEELNVDVGLNRTVVYFLLGKGVIRIERHTPPIAIYIC
ncbi:hypothetical protein O181_053128 [Austropuccinia psidii MF-1]|uniref:Uncharacterized protein n=1 Tax=Austropuccinia psidii MF-1 TaxID=1389203 RepID=A0A9Q3HQ41_9BASI|nr:hypothetical protein [Austropuccinia psidii MF-1]